MRRTCRRDRALVETAEVLRRTFRATDILARLGGDEFVVRAAECGDDLNGTIIRKRFAVHLASQMYAAKLRRRIDGSRPHEPVE